MQFATTNVPHTDQEATARRSERDRLVRLHLPLVRAIAAGVRGSSVGAGIPLDDLVAYGSNGLLDAAERFEPDRGIPFEVFCRYRVRGAIIDGVRRHHWLPRRMYKRLCSERAALDGQPANDNADPIGGGSADPGAPGPVFAEVELTSLDPADHEASSGARWNGRPMFQPTVEADDRLHVHARAAIQKLPYKERRLIELCYFEGKNLVEAGEALGMQRSWACRLHARAIASLRAALSS